MNTKEFANRHIGISEADLPEMLEAVGVASVDELIKQTIPNDILYPDALDLPEAMSEREYTEHILELAGKNQLFTSYIGQGWYDTVTPAVVQRNILENPAWYTSYTPYQAEISQGRLEALFNFQTVITELTGLPLTNSSLLDEATAGAEAARMLYDTRSRQQVKENASTLFVDEKVFLSTIEVIRTRIEPQGMKLVIGDYKTFEFDADVFAAIVQFPNADGSVEDYKAFVAKAHEAGAKVAVAADLLSLAILEAPGNWGADVVFGSAQRFGIPMYFGGPSAGYLSCGMDYKRSIPGRIIGMSKDAYGKPAYRLALQTREQHIKRERATSNICTAQALLATMSGFYAVYHGADGLRNIATTINSYAGFLSEKLTAMGYKQTNKYFFDTLRIELPASLSREELRAIAEECRVNFFYPADGSVVISLDETTDQGDIGLLIYIFSTAIKASEELKEDIDTTKCFLPEALKRTSEYLNYELFKKYRTETEMMRYMKRLEKRDISLATSMIPLGSCTMKLNAATELLPLSMPQFGLMHPYAPAEQAEGYLEMLHDLERYLAVITGFHSTSLQPNSGAAGEYTGLLVIKEYLKSKGQGHRNLIILPDSAHGTNPASAIQCGFKTITVKSDVNGNVDMADFHAKCEKFGDDIAAMMITYPSTHGIFETNIVELCDTIHKLGGQVYMDGANMNAQVGLTSPGFIGADVCHLNLHKTFAIPHGGGGPGVGPICVAEHLAEHLPKHPITDENYKGLIVSSAPFGSAGVTLVTYAYIRMMGFEGLRRASQTAILSANYMASKFVDNYGIVYTGANGRVGHELILECRKVKDMSGIDETDIAKRLADFNYHAPTLSFPVHGTLMIEPTESESLDELKRFIKVMETIWNEIQDVVSGKADAENNVLKNSPHPLYEVTGNEWNHPYTREQAAFALDYLKDDKFWVNVARIDNGFGDRNLVPSFCEACQSWPAEEFTLQ